MTRESAPGLRREMTALRLLTLERARSLPERRRQLLHAATPVLTVLFARYLTHDVQAPDWPERDRFVVSAVFHPAICALLHLLGRNGNGNGTDGHAEDAERDAATARPCNPQASGLDLPMEQPGHGLAAAVGMAVASRNLRETFGEGIDHGTYALIDDADVEPGVAQEAIAVAPHLLPHRLIVLHLTPVRHADEDEGRCRCPNHLARFAAAGWHVQQVRADDVAGIGKALEQAADQDTATWQERRPAYIAVEYDPVALPDAEQLRADLGWQALAPGEVPEAERDIWRLAGLRGRKAHKAWQQWLEELDDQRRAVLQHRLEAAPYEGFVEMMRGLRRTLTEEVQPRDLQALTMAMAQATAGVRDDMLTLAATHGGLPAAAGLPGVEKTEPAVPDIGLRPAAMAALLTGVAAHGGFLPVGFTLRRQLPAMVPVLEEAAAAKLRFVLVLFDDDEACTRPVQALLPDGVECLCPADAVELAECWQVALQRTESPAVIVLPAGEAVALRTAPEKSNLAALGAYEIHVAEDTPQGVVFAMGAPLAAAVRAARRLETENVGIRVVAVPAPDRLLRQSPERVARIVGEEDIRLLLMQPPAPLVCELLRQGGSFMAPCDDEGRRLSEEEITSAVVRHFREALASRRAEPDDGNGAGEE